MSFNIRSFFPIGGSPISTLDGVRRGRTLDVEVVVTSIVPSTRLPNVCKRCILVDFDLDPHP